MRFFTEKVNEAIKKKSKRMNFHQEIADLNALFNYYKEHFNYRFHNPVTKGLKASSVVRKNTRAKEKMSAQEFLLFFNALPEFYRDVALVQSRLAARVGEVAGLQISNIDFKKDKAIVKDVVVWGRKKEFIELKPNPKNGEIRTCHLTPDLKEILLKRVRLKSSVSDYVFHIDGLPLKYRAIQYNYDHALKKVGLYGRFSGTHLIRHGMASIALEVCENISFVQALTGHKTLKLAQHYSGLPTKLQEKAALQVESYLNEVALLSVANVQACADEAV